MKIDTSIEVPYLMKYGIKMFFVFKAYSFSILIKVPSVGTIL
jgi:hypothetical protein